MLLKIIRSCAHLTQGETEATECLSLEAYCSVLSGAFQYEKSVLGSGLNEVLVLDGHELPGRVRDDQKPLEPDEEQEPSRYR